MKEEMNMRKIPKKPVENVGGVDFNPLRQQSHASLLQRMAKKRAEVLKTTLLAHRYRMIFRKDA